MMAKRGLFDKIFGKEPAKIEPQTYFKMLNGYTPIYNSYEGGVYEMELTRAAIHAIANNASKLKPKIVGTAYAGLSNVLLFKPNPYMDTKNFIYRTVTIREVENNSFIVPLLDANGWVTGLFPIRQQVAELIDVSGEMYIKFRFPNGQTTILPYASIGHLRKFYYKNDIFGESNAVLNTTMQVLRTQQEGIINGIKSSATIRFLAKLAAVLQPKDVTAERNRLKEDNLSVENEGGIFMYDSKYSDITAIDQRAMVINPTQINAIKQNVYTYFGVNDKILTNCYNEDEWNAFYEGVIEPIAIELSLVLTNMLFTDREKATGNQVVFEANRLQYASNSSKLSIATALVDRGIITLNEAGEIFNIAPFEGGDIRVIRKEYIEVQKLGTEMGLSNDTAGT